MLGTGEISKFLRESELTGRERNTKHDQGTYAEAHRTFILPWQ